MMVMYHTGHITAPWAGQSNGVLLLYICTHMQACWMLYAPRGQIKQVQNNKGTWLAVTAYAWQNLQAGDANCAMPRVISRHR